MCVFFGFICSLLHATDAESTKYGEIGIVSEKTVVAQSTRAGPEMIIYIYISTSRWWFQIFFMFIPTWENRPI